MIVQVSRFTDGTRRVASISEIIGMEQSTITTQEVFRYEKSGVDDMGTVLGRFHSTGIRPKAISRFEAAGIHLPATVFESHEDPE